MATRDACFSVTMTASIPDGTTAVALKQVEFSVGILQLYPSVQGWKCVLLWLIDDVVDALLKNPDLFWNSLIL